MYKINIYFFEEITEGDISSPEFSLPRMPAEPEMVVRRLDHEPRDTKQKGRKKNTNTNNICKEKQPQQHT